jgi:hypothetical protein
MHRSSIETFKNAAKRMLVRSALVLLVAFAVAASATANVEGLGKVASSAQNRGFYSDNSSDDIDPSEACFDEKTQSIYLNEKRSPNDIDGAFVERLYKCLKNKPLPPFRIRFDSIPE